MSWDCTCALQSMAVEAFFWSGNLLWINSVWKWKLDGGIFDLQKNWVHVWHCLAVSASFWPILGAFGLALQNVGLMLGCGCHHGVLMVSPSCPGTALAVCLRFRGVGCGLWVCCVLVRRVVLVVSQSWFGGVLVECRWLLGATPAVCQCWLRRCVLVAPGRACMCLSVCELFYWCCGGI